MKALMQDHPLSLVHFFDRAERLFFDKRVVTATATGREERTYGEWAARTRRLGGALDALGISSDGRVATFGWNTANHLELYFAAPCSGRVLHTLNIRLFPEQLTYIANHAEDEVLFVDRTLAAAVWPLIPTFESVRHIVVLDDGAGDVPDAPAGKEVHAYEDLLAAAEPVEWHVEDEWQAASMCYTSGTTGNPKGVVYSHRSTYLHTMGVMAADAIGASETDTILPVVPMFHANAWGLAHVGVAVGANLVMPGPNMAPAALAGMIEDEKVTIAAGVPTIWMGVLPELKGRDLSALRAIPCGGSAVPKALSEAYREQVGLAIFQAWGMTETSPVATAGHIKSTLAAGRSEDELADLRATIGVPLAGVDIRVVDPDTLAPVATDGQAQGEIQAKGSWIAASYYDDPRSPESFTADGWLKTGDVATIDEHGYMRIVDRTKDVVKSGGEWISTVELENEIMAHPKVAEAAVIGVRHPKWQERPLACVVVREGEELTAAEVLEFLDGKVAKWWMPDDVVFVEEIPKTSVGKFSKKDLRTQFQDYELPTAGDA
ncbi:MAG: long-chain fatty acid--CoA ligase [Acidimicrobiales bacterium]|nr:long-chain fatty acid--CoA ligase [Acidimicrobiales bacterium]